MNGSPRDLKTLGNWTNGGVVFPPTTFTVTSPFSDHIIWKDGGVEGWFEESGEQKLASWWIFMQTRGEHYSLSSGLQSPTSKTPEKIEPHLSPHLITRSYNWRSCRSPANPTYHTLKHRNLIYYKNRREGRVFAMKKINKIYLTLKERNSFPYV